MKNVLTAYLWFRRNGYTCYYIQGAKEWHVTGKDHCFFGYHSNAGLIRLYKEHKEMSKQ